MPPRVYSTSTKTNISRKPFPFRHTYASYRLASSMTATAARGFRDTARPPSPKRSARHSAILPLVSIFLMIRTMDDPVTPPSPVDDFTALAVPAQLLYPGVR